MSSDEWIKLSSPLVKIGNSYAVRLPMSTVKELGVKEGQAVIMKVKKLDLTWTPELLSAWFKAARECKELDSYSDDKIMLLSSLAHNRGKHIIEAVDNNWEPKDTKDAAKKMNNALKSYNTRIKEEFGTKVYDDFERFMVIMQPKIAGAKKKE